MKANRTFRTNRNDRAEVGVGTMIVFIAMVLVAAVAAAVLISTGGTLQERASATGKEATQEVSSNLQLMSIHGKVVSGKLDSVNFTFTLAAGAAPMDLSQLMIRYANGTAIVNLPYDDTNDNPSTNADAGSIAANKFGLYWIRSVDSSIVDANSPPVMRGGDLTEVWLKLPNGIDTRKDLEFTFFPEIGAPVPANFRTPSTYAGNTYVQLEG